MSRDKSMWAMLLEDTLEDASGADDCEIPTVSFDVNPATVGRYVRFTAKTYYGYAVSLDYISFRMHY